MSLGILLLSALSFLLFRKLKRRVFAEKAAKDTQAAHNMKETERLHDRNTELGGDSAPQKLEHAQGQPGERYYGEVYEAGGS